MADGHGGYRRPSRPAPASGPGANSRRTDGRANKMDLPDAGYGEQQDFRGIEAGAVMGSGQPSAPALGAIQAPPARQVVPLTEGSMQPDVPVTAGADYGAGPSSAVLGLDATTQDLAQYGRYMPFLMKLANDPNTSVSTRTAIRQLFSKS